MKLIFGLGNPGPQYIGTRHNVGFALLGTYATSHDMVFIEKSKFKAEIAESTIDGEKLLLARPTTFYNSVGESFNALKRFYNLVDKDCLIAHDELALPFGSIRVRAGGSDAGNNGIKSINSHGGNDSIRMRVGIANEMRETIGDSDFVLAKFSRLEVERLNAAYSLFDEIIDNFLHETLTLTTYQLSDKV